MSHFRNGSLFDQHANTNLRSDFKCSGYSANATPSQEAQLQIRPQGSTSSTAAAAAVPSRTS
jgi:hypothetical protein